MGYTQKITITLSKERPPKGDKEGSWGTLTFVPFKVSLFGPKNKEIASKVVYGTLHSDGLRILLADELKFSFKKKTIIMACRISPVHSPWRWWYLDLNSELPVIVTKVEDVVLRNLEIYFG